MSISDETLGTRIKKIRKEQKLTQEELGKKCGTSGAMIRQYELGVRHPKIETLSRIAVALNVDIESLNTPINNEQSYCPADVPAQNQASQKQVSYVEDDQLLNLLNKLNKAGRLAAIHQIELILRIPEYRIDNTPLPEEGE